jgi:SAM-dependent methyltransferase
MEHNKNTIQNLPEIFEAGYPKTDVLFAGLYDRSVVLAELGLDPARKTVLYAPAFNEKATLRTIGSELVAAMASLRGINLIIKLAPDSIRKKDNIYATGGVCWREQLKQHESERCRIADDLDINRYLVAADVMVTDVSGVAYDFLVLGKPVIYYDCPQFYSEYVTRFDDSLTFDECLSDDSINAGRNYGLVVKSIDELISRLEEHLKGEFPLTASVNGPELFLYHPGHATENSLSKIDGIISEGCVRRKTDSGSFWGQLTSAFKHVCFGWLHKRVDRILNLFGYRLANTGYGYLDAATTVKAAREAGLSVCEYLETRDSDPRKLGRRDRIIDRMKQWNVFRNDRICEIGAGTGMYLEKTIAVARPEFYEVYETNPGWFEHLRENYASDGSCAIMMRTADGCSLRDTSSDSCDLVHAHGVFVYLPILQTFEYIKESARVCKSGGHIVFDCFLDTSFSLADILKWHETQWRFPVVIPERLLEEYAALYSLQLVGKFEEIYGASAVNYLVFKKRDVAKEG